MQTAFTKIEEEKTALTKTGRKTALTEIGEEGRPLHRNRRGGKTDLTETEEREEETGVWERNNISRL